MTPCPCPAQTASWASDWHWLGTAFSTGHFLLNVSWSPGLSKSTCQSSNSFYPPLNTHTDTRARTHTCMHQRAGGQSGIKGVSPAVSPVLLSSNPNQGFIPASPCITPACTPPKVGSRTLTFPLLVSQFPLLDVAWLPLLSFFHPSQHPQPSLQAPACQLCL